MSLTRFTSSVLLTCTAFAFALAGCTSDQTDPPGIGSVDMTVTLATPPSGPNEQIDEVFVELYCDGVLLGPFTPLPSTGGAVDGGIRWGMPQTRSWTSKGVSRSGSSANISQTGGCDVNSYGSRASFA